MPDHPEVSEATAAFTDVFQFPGETLDESAPAMVERDRLIMAARPGMVRKLLPLREGPPGLFSGGCYLFDTRDHAEAFHHWVADEFELDGTLFFDRPPFMEPFGMSWDVIGIEDFGDVNTSQQLMRLERWHTLHPLDPDELRSRHWPAIRSRAEETGLTTAWMLYDPDPHHPQLGLVTAAGDEAARAAGERADLSRLEATPSVAEELAAEVGAAKVFDRTSLVYMVWFPLEGENVDHEGSAVWPNSPPLPAPAERGSAAQPA